MHSARMCVCMYTCIPYWQPFSTSVPSPLVCDTSVVELLLVSPPGDDEILQRPQLAWREERDGEEGRGGWERERRGT